ncbi:MAG: hypothetical protein ABSE40_10665 [Candidatus Sulfotelmatobacter sp.]
MEPQQPRNVEGFCDGVVGRILSLRVSQSSAEANKLYQETKSRMSARERLKFDYAIEKEMLRIQRARKRNAQLQPRQSVNSAVSDAVAEQNTGLPLPRGEPMRTAGFLDSLDILDIIATVIDAGVRLVIFAFWIALAIVVFHMACRIVL